MYPAELMEMEGEGAKAAPQTGPHCGLAFAPTADKYRGTRRWLEVPLCMSPCLKRYHLRAAGRHSLHCWTRLKRSCDANMLSWCSPRTVQTEQWWCVHSCSSVSRCYHQTRHWYHLNWPKATSACSITSSKQPFKQRLNISSRPKQFDTLV
ncbi:unnamed protein product [Acanthoscelides obtectus]|uniref:Uncharacterized protein n=1 Tax=Acanthoscelides obtectus TaxID=200917 RepID=A0A9P0KHK6_ACAOB|nr:unnamed protein product [Acanthoscelides obtectus]CAK1667715.1 hypothetical protein AOBTE_LOCUS26004 [Acanthoscelides obtectus]